MAKTSIPSDKNVPLKIVSKNKEEERKNVKTEPSFQIDDDLQMPSEIFDCNFLEDKDEVKEIPGEFYFETDHEALRGNPDYHKLLKIYAVLQAKKIQVSYHYSQLTNKRVGWNKRAGRNFLFKFNKLVDKIWCCLPIKCSQIRASRVDFFFLKRISEFARLLKS